MKKGINNNLTDLKQSMELLEKTAQLVVKSGELRRSMGTDTASSLLISVIIPVRDEEKTLGSVLFDIDESLADFSHEVIVVDDGSRDKTAEIAAEAIPTSAGLHNLAAIIQKTSLVNPAIIEFNIR